MKHDVRSEVFGLFCCLRTTFQLGYFRCSTSLIFQNHQIYSLDNAICYLDFVCRMLGLKDSSKLNHPGKSGQWQKKLRWLNISFTHDTPKKINRPVEYMENKILREVTLVTG